MAMGPNESIYKPQPGRVVGLDTGNTMTTFDGLKARYAWPDWRGIATNDVIPAGVLTVPSLLDGQYLRNAEYDSYMRNMLAQQPVSPLQMENALREQAQWDASRNALLRDMDRPSPLWARAERPHAEPAPVLTHSDNLRWLTQRVDEMRVKLC